MATVLDLIWSGGNKYFSENRKKRLDNPVKKQPDGQITRPSRSTRDAKAQDFSV